LTQSKTAAVVIVAVVVSLLLSTTEKTHNHCQVPCGDVAYRRVASAWIPTPERKARPIPSNEPSVGYQGPGDWRHGTMGLYLYDRTSMANDWRHSSPPPCTLEYSMPGLFITLKQCIGGIFERDRSNGRQAASSSAESMASRRCQCGCQCGVGVDYYKMPLTVQCARAGKSKGRDVQLVLNST
jgi:hypothetical protein